MPHRSSCKYYPLTEWQSFVKSNINAPEIQGLPFKQRLAALSLLRQKLAQEGKHQIVVSPLRKSSRRRYLSPPRMSPAALSKLKYYQSLPSGYAGGRLPCDQFTLPGACPQYCQRGSQGKCRRLSAAQLLMSKYIPVSDSKHELLKNLEAIAAAKQPQGDVLQSLEAMAAKHGYPQRRQTIDEQRRAFLQDKEIAYSPRTKFIGPFSPTYTGKCSDSVFPYCPPHCVGTRNKSGKGGYCRESSLEYLKKRVMK